MRRKKDLTSYFGPRKKDKKDENGEVEDVTEGENAEEMCERATGTEKDSEIGSEGDLQAGFGQVQFNQAT